MRVLIILAIILLPACSTTSSYPATNSHEPGVITSSNKRLSNRNADRPLYRCRTGYVLVCDADDKNAQCACESRQRFRFDRPPQAINLRQ